MQQKSSSMLKSIIDRHRLDRVLNDDTAMEREKESTIQVGRLQLIIYQSIDSAGAGMMDSNQKWALKSKRRRLKTCLVSHCPNTKLSDSFERLPSPT